MERDQALKFMHDLLRLMSQKNGSDLFITANFPPAIKVDGKITPVSNQTLTPQHTADLARSIMNDRQAAEFESTKECNFAISPSGIGRFRVNALIQQGRVAVVCRTINLVIPTLEELAAEFGDSGGVNMPGAPSGISPSCSDAAPSLAGGRPAPARTRVFLAHWTSATAGSIFPSISEIRLALIAFDTAASLQPPPMLPT